MNSNLHKVYAWFIYNKQWMKKKCIYIMHSYTYEEQRASASLYACEIIIYSGHSGNYYNNVYVPCVIQ